MRKIIVGFVAMILISKTNAQLCPGGGLNFSSVVTFDQSWIQGCTNGTTCNGGVGFDNRVACEPTGPIDACAPAPTCTSATNGSDIWFRFYATSTIATIKVIQQISFIAAIQAFSGGPTCGGLTQIGCSLAGGPSSGVTLNLAGLIPGQPYYFRIFGSSNVASQRTGTFCFCGSIFLGSAPLPVVLKEFKATPQKNRVILSWTTASELDNRSFEIERSIDGTNFTGIASIPGKGTTNSLTNYDYTDLLAVKGANYYRLKITDANNRHVFSDIRLAKIDYGKTLSVFTNPVREKLIIDASGSARILILNMAGHSLQSIQLKRGRNEIPVSHLAAGSYFIKSITDNESYRFSIIK